MILIKTDFLNAIEKALRGSQRDNHKYIFRREVAEKTSGKSVRRYEYVYEEDRKLHPLEMLKKFFGISQKEVDADYEKGNIQKDFGADKPTFAQHLLEYFCHRSIWDKRFAKKDNQDKFKKPVKMQTFKETASTVSKDMETPEAESTEPSLFSDKELKKLGAKNENEWKANPYLMRKIWGMYTGKTIDEKEAAGFERSPVVGDKVTYNDRVGTVSDVYNNGMMFINFDDGGVGRINEKDLKIVESTLKKEAGKKMPKEIVLDGKKWSVKKLADGNIELSSNSDLGGSAKDIKVGTVEQINNLIEAEKKKTEKDSKDDSRNEKATVSGGKVALPSVAEYEADYSRMTELRYKQEKAKSEISMKDPLDKKGLRLAWNLSKEKIVEDKEMDAIAKKYAFMGVDFAEPTEKDIARVALNYFDIFDKESKLLSPTSFIHDSRSPQYGNITEPLGKLYNEKVMFKDTELANAIRNYGKNRDLESRAVLERYADAYGDDHYNRSLAMLGNQNAKKDGSGGSDGGDGGNRNGGFTGDLISENERKKDLQNQNPTEIFINDFRGLSDSEIRTVAKQKYGMLNPIEKDGIKIEFKPFGFNETKSHSADKKVLYVLGQLDDILKNAVFMYAEPNSDPKKTNTLNVLNYAAKTKIDGEEYYTRIVVREDKDGNYYYDNDSTSVEKVKANLRLNTAPNAGHHENSPYIDRVSQWLGGVKEKANNKHDKEKFPKAIEKLPLSKFNKYYKKIVENKDKSAIVNALRSNPDKHYYASRIGNDILATFGEDSKEFQIFLDNLEFYERISDTSIPAFALKGKSYVMLENFVKDKKAFDERNEKRVKDFF